MTDQDRITEALSAMESYVEPCRESFCDDVRTVVSVLREVSQLHVKVDCDCDLCKETGIEQYCKGCLSDWPCDTAQVLEQVSEPTAT